MHTTGLFVATFGGVVAFAGLVALLCRKTDGKMSGAETFDFFVLGGIFSLFRDLFRGIAEGLRNRSSSAFHYLVLIGAGIGLLMIGLSLIYFSGTR